MDTLRKCMLHATFLAAAGASVCATAAEPASQPGNLIPGLGERIPAGAKDVSLSPRFKVYTFVQNGVKYVQINSPQDDVLTALIVTPGLQQQLPIGAAAGTPVVFVSEPAETAR